jgi:hypothetical protein
MIKIIFDNKLFKDFFGSTKLIHEQMEFLKNKKKLNI